MEEIISCQEETGQDLTARGREQAVEEAVWTVPDRVQGQSGTAYAPTAVRKCRIKQGLLVTRKNVPHVEQK